MGRKRQLVCRASGCAKQAFALWFEGGKHPDRGYCLDCGTLRWNARREARLKVTLAAGKEGT